MAVSVVGLLEPAPGPRAGQSESIRAERAGPRFNPVGLAWLFVVAAAVQMTVVLFTHLLGVTEPFFLDAAGQHESGVEIAEFWAREGWPTVAEVEEIAGTQLWGPQLLIGAVYRFFGTDWLFAKLVLALGTSTGAVGAFVLGSRLGGRRVGWPSYLIAALWPTTLFWSSAGIKDGFLCGIGLGALAVISSLRGARSGFVAAGFAGAMFFFRPGLSAALVVGAAAMWLLASRDGGGRRRLLAVGSMALAGGLVLGPSVARLAGEAETLQIEVDGELVAVAEGGLTKRVAASVRPQTAAKALASPIPWVWDPQNASPYRWLYPGSAVWIAALPAICLGAVAAVRRRHPVGILVAGFCATYFGLYLVTYGGEFARQRSVIEPAALILAAYAFAHDGPRAIRITAGWVACVSAAAIGHLVLLSL